MVRGGGAVPMSDGPSRASTGGRRGGFARRRFGRGAGDGSSRFGLVREFGGGSFGGKRGGFGRFGGRRWSNGGRRRYIEAAAGGVQEEGLQYKHYFGRSRNTALARRRMFVEGDGNTVIFGNGRYREGGYFRPRGRRAGGGGFGRRQGRGAITRFTFTRSRGGGGGKPLGAGRGGRGGNRGGRSGGRGGASSEADLNAQLDAYMGEDVQKNRLDQQLDSYFSRAGGASSVTEKSGDVAVVGGDSLDVATAGLL